MNSGGMISGETAEPTANTASEHVVVVEGQPLPPVVVPPNLRPQTTGALHRATDDSAVVEDSENDRNVVELSESEEGEDDLTFDPLADAAAEDPTVVEEGSTGEGHGGEDDEIVSIEADSDGAVEEAEETASPPAFALARVKRLMRLSSSARSISAQAVVRMTAAVEHVLSDLCHECLLLARRREKLTVTYDHVAEVVHTVDRFSFLTEVIPAARQAGAKRPKGSAQRQL